MQVDLTGRTAVVAGGDTGLGAAIAEACEANGAMVERLPISAAEPTSIRARLDDMARRNGALHILIDASPLPVGGEQTGYPTSAVRRAEALIQSAGDVMAAHGGGRIVTLVSALALLPARREPLVSASHGALAATIRVRAMEFAPRGVLVNAVAVGANGTDHPELVSHVPLGRAATVGEVAAAALFLVDPQNTYMAGHILLVDGGWHAGFARDF